MKRMTLAFLAMAIALSGCQKQQAATSDPIREGIQRHLDSLKTLNLGAMDMKISNVAITGDTAQAQVEYLPKTGAPAGATMRVSYTLEKHDQQWDVVKTNTLGGAIEHPAPGANPHTQAQGPVHDSLPNFRDIIPATTPDANPAMPPGHPPAATDPPPQ